MTPLIAATLARVSKELNAHEATSQHRKISERTKRIISPNSFSYVNLLDRKYLLSCNFRSSYDSRPTTTIFPDTITNHSHIALLTTTTMNATPCDNAAGYMGFGLATTLTLLGLVRAGRGAWLGRPFEARIDLFLLSILFW
jgi:hypothetical protein